MLPSVAELIEKGGVDVNSRDKDNITALHWAAINNRVPLIQCVVLPGSRGFFFVGWFFFCWPVV
jgi:ankyrin repeat protein